MEMRHALNTDDRRFGGQERIENFSVNVNRNRLLAFTHSVNLHCTVDHKIFIVFHFFPQALSVQLARTAASIKSFTEAT
jgi:hypothetical protein